MSQLRSTKFTPYRILVILTYHDYSWAEWTGLHCKVKIGNLARFLQTTVYRIVKYFEALQQYGYIHNLVHNLHGTLEFDLYVPERIQKLTTEITSDREASTTDVC